MAENIWGDVIDRALAEAGLTQREVERRGGIPRNSISRWRRGRCSPSVENQEKFAKGCGITFSALRSSYAEIEHQRSGKVPAPSASAQTSGAADTLGTLEARLREINIEALDEHFRSVMFRSRDDIVGQLLQMESRIRLFLEHYRLYAAMTGKKPLS